MVKQFGVSDSTITFEIDIVKLIKKQPRIKNVSPSLKFITIITKRCEENASEFE